MFEPIDDVRLKAICNALETDSACGWITSAPTVGQLVARIHAAEEELAVARVNASEADNLRLELAIARRVVAPTVGPVPEVLAPAPSEAVAEAADMPAVGG